MKVSANLTDLLEFHPHLEWDSIIAATAGLLRPKAHGNKAIVKLSIENAADFVEPELLLSIEIGGISSRKIAQVKRTFDSSRLVEMGAIAIGGLAVYYVGRHEIYDVAYWGSGADYFLDGGSYLFEVAGRSRRTDLNAAWNERADKTGRYGRLFLVFVGR